ncbi:MAG: rubrerythrin [Thermoprotei archaeon]|nr:MAG: rubrerythrin [Thermoprotei archaeon]
MLSKNPIDLSRKLEGEFLVQALRYALIGELDAINQYLQLANAVTDEDVRKVLIDIANEEKVHVAELLTLIRKLDKEQQSAFEKGAKEVSELTKGRF